MPLFEPWTEQPSAISLSLGSCLFLMREPFPRPSPSTSMSHQAKQRARQVMPRKSLPLIFGRLETQSVAAIRSASYWVL